VPSQTRIPTPPIHRMRACKGGAKDDEKGGQKRYAVQPFPLYAHVPDSLGTAHGPLDAGPPCRTP
jgi:hypothetical protein